jgi:hypothetical protein
MNDAQVYEMQVQIWKPNTWGVIITFKVWFIGVCIFSGLIWERNDIIHSALDIVPIDSKMPIGTLTNSTSDDLIP